MTQPSRRLAAVLAVTVASALAACATPTPAPEPAAAAQAQTKDSVDASGTVTGSRIPRTSTERLLHKTGAAGAAEMERNRPPNPGGLNGP